MESKEIFDRSFELVEVGLHLAASAILVHYAVANVAQMFKDLPREVVRIVSVNGDRPIDESVVIPNRASETREHAPEPVERYIVVRNIERAYITDQQSVQIRTVLASSEFAHVSPLGGLEREVFVFERGAVFPLEVFGLIPELLGGELPILRVERVHRPNSN